MAKQAVQRSRLGASRSGTEKQTQHVQNLEIQTELGLLWNQSPSRAIFGKPMAGQKMSQLRQMGNGSSPPPLFKQGENSIAY